MLELINLLYKFVLQFTMSATDRAIHFVTLPSSPCALVTTLGYLGRERPDGTFTEGLDKKPEI